MLIISSPNMTPLEPVGLRFARTWLGPVERPGLLALGHALEFPRPGLWGDDRLRPRNVLLVREGSGGRSEVFGAGMAEPAVEWLADQSSSFILLAPESWREPLERRVGPMETAEVETWSTNRVAASGSSAIVHRLSFENQASFEAVAPDWALRGWRTFDQLVTHGAAFGVFNRDRLVAMAWIFDQAGRFDAIGVATLPEFRRLGLARASASALIDHIINLRGRAPLWSTSVENLASRSLAGALGFSRVQSEKGFFHKKGPESAPRSTSDHQEPAGP